MGRLYVVLFALQVLLVVLALISCLSAEDGQLRALPRFVWIILILLFPLVGSIVYFVAGRPLPANASGQTRQGMSTHPPRPLAPDDDPEFLRTIDTQRRKEDEELLRRWEEDLRRREDKLPKQEDTPPTDS